ncbi:probable calcium-binding protein CML31 [Andrographis paniculata]|uniref:probable calcium-binding protein CML31 n=1 Tax=Andrographis paniculata TaxID=175694 RepID=UPI0021E95D3E|nr:probable calcium-binding protein CML31 [Andrographis paniculata]
MEDQLYNRVFSHFDANKDGKICAAELLQCLASIGAEMTPEEAAAAVAAMDSDGDGLLSLEDFLRIVEAAGEEEKTRDLKAAFGMYEESAGAGGCITPKSLRRMLSRLGVGEKTAITVEDCRGMIASFDLNGDGVLSFHEFVAMMSPSSSSS